MRRVLILAALTAATVGGVGIGTADAQAADGCPNAAIRAEQRAAVLPDCRAYEKVTPEDKADSDIIFFGGSRSSDGGDAIAYQSGGAFADPKGAGHSDTYRSTRGASGWTTTALTPYLAASALAQFVPANAYQAFSPDLSAGVFQGTSDPADPDAEWGPTRLYLRNADGTIVAIEPTPDPDPGPFAPPAFTGASDDFGTITFQTRAALVPGAPAGVNNLYVWRDGQLGLVADGTDFPAGASAPPGAAGDATHRAISPDGSQILFTAGSPSQLWLAQTGSAPVEISLSQNEDAGTAGDEAPSGVTFMGTTSAGGKLQTVYFIGADALTDDATVGTSGQGSDLYAYDVEHGTLTDLVIDPDDPNGAQIAHGRFGIDPTLPFFVNDDGSRVYFHSLNKLTDGATANSDNLYLLDGDGVRFVGPLGSFPTNGDFRMAADGRRLVYLTDGQLTPQDNGGLQQVYLYDVDSGWSCVSCRPDGGRSTSIGNVVGFATGYVAPGVPAYRNRAISDDGRRVFFETAEALVPEDTNGKIDVYEWEDGAPHLISAGTGAGDSHFLDASRSGDDVFITTRDHLTAEDRDPITDVYDARVGGGFAVQDTAATTSCEGDACQGTPRAVPALPVAATVTFSGPGDVVEPGGEAGPRKAGAVRTVRARTVRGSALRLRVRVAGRGILRVTGRGIRRVARTTSKAATYRVTVRLTKRARRALARRHHVTRVLTVRFTPRGGASVSAHVRVTFRAPRARQARRAARRAAGLAAAASRAAVLSSTARKGR